MKLPRIALTLVAPVVAAFIATACTKSTVEPSSTSSSSSSACTVTVASVPTTVTAAGVTGTLAVTAASGCSWTATPSASFITVSPSSGTGNGSVQYTVAANTGAQRSASIVITGNTINFTQESPKAPATCAVSISPSSASLTAASGTTTVAVTSTNSACAWTAAADSSSSFLTVSPASGTGSGSVTVTATANTGGARTGTVTIGGQTFTVSQAGSGLIASFQLLDPGQTAGPVTECRIRGTGSTTCTLQSTSFSKNNIVLYEWQIQYTYVTIKTSSPSSTFPTTTITDSCGQTGSTDDGTQQPLSVLLKVTDSLGNTSTATAGSGNQPPLFITLYTCGK